MARITARSLLATALLAVAGATTAAEPVRIGFHAPLTGFAAADGESARIGAELAVEQANAAGGIDGRRIELVTYDDQAAAQQAVPIANRLIGQDQVDIAVSGSYSAPTRAAAQIFQEERIPYISAYAVHPDITCAGDYVFRTSFMGRVQGRAGAKLIGNIMGNKRVTMITLQNDFGTALAEGFRNAADRFGIEILGEYEYGIKDRRFGSIVSKVKAESPDAIYASGYYFTAAPLVSQLRAAGVDVPIIGQEGYDSAKFLEIAGDAAEGVIITTSLNRDSTRDEAQAFIEQFEDNAGFGADMVAASAHTAVKVAVAAMRRAGTGDPAKIRRAIAEIEGLPVSTGVISFNELGEVRKNVQVQIVRDGEWHEHAVIDDRELLAPPTSCH